MPHNKIAQILKEISDLNKLDNKTLPERFVKYNEEYGEFNAEVAKMLGITHKPYDEDHLKEEMADWIQNVFSISIDICEKQGFTMEEIFELILLKNKKWQEKAPLYTKNTENIENLITKFNDRWSNLLGGKHMNVEFAKKFGKKIKTFIILYKQLEQAIMNEEYEKAAEIKIKIDTLKNNG